MADPRRPGSHPSKHQSKDVSPPFEHLYKLSNADGATIVIRSPFGLERSCRFEHAGRKYEASGLRSPGLQTIPCVEIPSES
jgi:hypothetical protein